MDRATWQQEWTNAWAEYQQAFQAWDSAMPSTQSSLPVQLASIDTANQLKGEMDQAWRRIVELSGNRPI